MNYRVAPEAEQDIADIWHFIAQENPPAADHVLDAIKDRFRQIAEQPEIGRTREELAPGLRSLTVRRYRRYAVFYQCQRGTVEIVRVLDGSRDLKRLFKR